jgi:hypothetical protein
VWNAQTSHYYVHKGNPLFRLNRFDQSKNTRDGSIRVIRGIAEFIESCYVETVLQGEYRFELYLYRISRITWSTDERKKRCENKWRITFLVIELRARFGKISPAIKETNASSTDFFQCKITFFSPELARFGYI